jgi:hypothetical protein
MGFYLRCRRLQSGAAAQADSGGMLMAKVPGFASAFAGRRRIVEMDISLRLRNLAEFFNSLLVLLSQKVAFCELGIVDKFGRFVFRHEELRWITQ